MTAAPDKSASWQARLRTLGWDEVSIKPLEYALKALGPGKITRLAENEVRFVGRDGQRWRWARGRCLTKDDGTNGDAGEARKP